MKLVAAEGDMASVCVQLNAIAVIEAVGKTVVGNGTCSCFSAAGELGLGMALHYKRKSSCNCRGTFDEGFVYSLARS